MPQSDSPAQSLDLAPLGGAGPRPRGSMPGLIRAWLGPLSGRALLDVGCGAGRLAGVLAAEGAQVTGIDPQEEIIREARAAVPAARFEVVGAAALPFADNSFDAVIFSNSLHHIPAAEMRPALAEAARVSRGPILVVEPLAEGPYFETVRLVEDETAVRAAAQEEISALLTAGRARLVAGGEYDDLRRFADVDGLLANSIAVDPARAATVARVRDAVAERFARLGRADGDKTCLPQPHRAHLLAWAEPV